MIRYMSFKRGPGSKGCQFDSRRQQEKVWPYTFRNPSEQTRHMKMLSDPWLAAPSGLGSEGEVKKALSGLTSAGADADADAGVIVGDLYEARIGSWAGFRCDRVDGRKLQVQQLSTLDGNPTSGRRWDQDVVGGENSDGLVGIGNEE